MTAPRTSKKQSSSSLLKASKGTDDAMGDEALPKKELPSPEEIISMLVPVRSFITDKKQERVRSVMQRMALSPPQVLLIEGGIAKERLAAAHYWATLLNCPEIDRPKIDKLAIASTSKSEPCLECPTCSHVVSHMHRDLFFFDGQAASIKIGDSRTPEEGTVRWLLPVLGEPPREALTRVVIFYEAQGFAKGDAAANALLKSFEEPRAGTVFIMTVPQRERLLPTLVSRSMPITLPWPHKHESVSNATMQGNIFADETEDSLLSLEAALCTFLQNGRGFFERTATKGALDAALGHSLVQSCQHALVACLEARQSPIVRTEGLAALFARLPAARLRYVDEALAEVQDSLNYGVNPVLAVEWLATRLYLLMPQIVAP